MPSFKSLCDLVFINMDMYIQSFRENWCFLTLAFNPLVLNIMPRFSKKETFGDFLNWAICVDSLSTFLGSVTTLAAHVLLQKKTAPRPGDEVCSCARRGRWSDAGLEDRRRPSRGQGECTDMFQGSVGFQWNWACLDNYTRHKNKNMSVFICLT